MKSSLDFVSRVISYAMGAYDGVDPIFEAALSFLALQAAFNRVVPFRNLFLAELIAILHVVAFDLLIADVDKVLGSHLEIHQAPGR